MVPVRSWWDSWRFRPGDGQPPTAPSAWWMRCSRCSVKIYSMCVAGRGMAPRPRLLPVPKIRQQLINVMLIQAVTKYAFKRSRRLRLEYGTSPLIAPSVITWFYMALTVGSCWRHKRTVFPGSATEKNPPADAGNSGPTPGLGWSHRPEQLSPCATAAEAAVWRPGGKLLKPVCL